LFQCVNFISRAQNDQENEQSQGEEDTSSTGDWFGSHLVKIEHVMSDEHGDNHDPTEGEQKENDQRASECSCQTSLLFVTFLFSGR
jgi:hypothetical protein